MDSSILYKLIKESHKKIEALESELEGFRSKESEPLAIIGMGCRFPGADNPEQFWQLLHHGVDVIREVPKDRWDLAKYYDPDPETPGKTHIRHGGFLSQINQFDAHFFGISPREAVSLDPQQRLLMEVSWEALENAALLPQQLDKNTGVFVGISGSQYANLLLEQAPEDIDVYLATGTATSVAAGRLSYFLGVQGPSMSVDTACSSSLVSVHLACQSLRHHECHLALAGGVNVNLVPEYNVNLSKAGMLAADGRCKTFDAQADGYGRSEGCGMIVIKRLSDALADGDPILALIRGSAVNQDGRTSGLTAPNGPAQQAVIREALKNANLEPAQVSYVEAHGTGTPLGDPIEVGALQAVFGQSPLIIGSAKSNLGHLEAAAGIAGLMKVVLSLQQQEIPPHLHFQQPNPYINWNESLTVPTKPMAWPLPAPTSPPDLSRGTREQGGIEGGRSRIAGVSSFGFSGTNAHLILEEAPPIKPCPGPESAQYGRNGFVERGIPRSHLLTLSAKTSDALTASVKRYLEYQTSHPAAELANICFTANTGRTHFAHRLSVLARSKDELHEELTAFAAGQETSQLFHGHAPQAPKIAFLFTGQGSQYVGMGRELYESQPVFRQALEQCDEILRRGEFLEQSLVELLKLSTRSVSSNQDDSPLNETAITQPALFVLGYALAQLWKSWGITPSVVCGHSVGEYVAACVAGVFSLEEGLALIAERGRLMQALPDGSRGQMVALWASERQVAEAIRPYTDKVSIAAINGPESVVISGDYQAIERVVAHLEEEGVKSKRLQVSHAFHSPLMEPMIKDFEQVARQVSYAAPRIKIISNVTGQLANPEIISRPEYWSRHIRQPVRFADGMNTLQRLGYDTFVEIGPQPTLLGMARHFIGEFVIPRNEESWLPSLRKGRDASGQMLTSLAELYVHGAEVNWLFTQDATLRRRVALPTYPWQRKVYWPAKVAQASAPINKQLSPLLNKMTRSPLLKETVFETLFSTERMPFLLDHRIYQEVVVPGACHISFLLSAAEQLFGKQACVLEDVVFPQALILPDGSELSRGLSRRRRELRERTVQLVLTPEKSRRDGKDAKGFSFQVISFPNQEQIGQTEQPKWEVHAIGRLFASQSLNDRVSIEERLTRCQEEIGGDTLYHKLSQANINLGPDFQWVDRIWQGDSEALCQIKRPQGINLEGYVLHPGLIDSSFQLAAMTTNHNSEEANDTLPAEETTLPFAIERCRFYFGTTMNAHHNGHVWGYVRQVENTRWDMQLLDESGQVMLEIAGFEGRPTSKDALLVKACPEGRGNTWHDWLYNVEWQPQAPSGITTSNSVGRQWLIFADDEGIGAALAAGMSARGEQPVLVFPASSYQQVDAQRYQIDPLMASDYRRLFKEQANLHGVVYLWNIDQKTNGNTPPTPLKRGVPASTPLLAQRAPRDLGVCSSLALKGMVERTLNLLQSLIVEYTKGLSLWLVTRDAQAVTKTDTCAGLMQSPLWGITQVMSLEHPEFESVLVDLEATSGHDVAHRAAKAAEQLLAETAILPATGQKAEDKVAFRNGQRYVARLGRYTVPSDVSDSSAPLNPEGSYLITGGLGGLGLRVAHWMVEEGAGQVILMGRSEPNEETKKQLAELAQAGTQITVAQADVANRKQVAQVLAEIPPERPLRGIIHAAGVLDDGTLLNQNWARFAKVYAPKVQGAWTLHTLTQEMSLDFFVLFSSTAALLGNPGQANYASANAFMDGLAHYRKAQNLPALSINWGAWAEVGMAAKTGLAQQFERQGFETITPELGLQAMSALIKEEITQACASAYRIAVAPINWSKWPPSPIQPAPFFENVIPQFPYSEGQASGQLWRESQEPEPLSFLQKLKQTSVAQRRVRLAAHVRQTVAKVFGAGREADPSDLIDVQQDLLSYGMDSLTSIELRNRLQKSLQCSLPATLAFRYPTISALVDYLAEEVLQDIFQRRAIDAALTCLIPIQPHGKRRPLFFASGIMGTVFNLYALSNYLGAEQPYYGLQSPGFEDEIEPYTRIEDIAAHYLRAVQTVQPEGPYLLAGYSWGSKVVFEMAHQLKKQGQEVPLVIMLDMPVDIAPKEYMASSIGDSTYLLELSYIFELTTGKTLGLSSDLLESRPSDEQLEYFLERVRKAELNLISEDEIKTILRTFKNDLLADIQYIPKPYTGKLMLFKADDMVPFLVEVTKKTDITWGWDQLSSEPVDVIPVPGDHYTMMVEPNVQVLAERITTCLDKFQD